MKDWLKDWLSTGLGAALGASVGLGIYDGVVVAGRGISVLESLRVAGITFGFAALLLGAAAGALAIVLAIAFRGRSPRALVLDGGRGLSAREVLGWPVAVAAGAAAIVLLVGPLHARIEETLLRHVAIVLLSAAVVPLSAVLGVVIGEVAERHLSVQEACSFTLMLVLVGLVGLTGSLGELSSLGADATIAPMLALALAIVAGISGSLGNRRWRRTGVGLLVLAVPLALAPVGEEVLAAVTFEAPIGGKLASLNPWVEDADLDPVEQESLESVPGPERFTLTKDTELRKPWPVIIVAVDSLRPDHLESYGYQRETSPNIDRLAEDGIVFQWAYALASSTHYSVPSLMTSQYMSELALDGRAIKRENTTLAEVLRKAGYYTVGLSSPALKGIGHGIEQGFELWRNFYKKKDKDKAITDRAIKIIQKRRKKPLFMWIHYYAPHSSYSSHKEAPQWGKRKLDRYDQEVWWADHQFGRLLDTIDEVYGPDGAVVIVTADHGEALGEHGRFGHSKTLYEELVRVPLIMRIPGAEPGTSPAKVSLLDVMPTVLDLTGAKFLGKLQGESLLPVLEGEPHDEERMVFQELRFGRADTKGQFGIRYRDYHAIFDVRSRSMRLYDVVEDPREEHDLSRQPEHRDVATQLRAAAMAQQKRAATGENQP